MCGSPSPPPSFVVVVVSLSNGDGVLSKQFMPSLELVSIEPLTKGALTVPKVVFAVDSRTSKTPFLGSRQNKSCCFPQFE